MSTRRAKIIIDVEGNAASNLDRVAKSAAKATQETDKAKHSTEQMGQGAKKLSAAFGQGGLAGDVEDLIEGFGGLTSGLGVTATAVAGIGVAAVASVGAVVAMVGALKSLSEAADKAAERMGDTVSEDQRRAIDNLRDGVTDLGSAWDQVTVAMAAAADEAGGGRLLQSFAGMLLLVGDIGSGVKRFTSDLVSNAASNLQGDDSNPIRSAAAGYLGQAASVTGGLMGGYVAGGLGRLQDTAIARADGGRSDADRAIKAANTASAKAIEAAAQTAADLADGQANAAEAFQIAAEYEARVAKGLEEASKAAASAHEKLMAEITPILADIGTELATLDAELQRASQGIATAYAAATQASGTTVREHLGGVAFQGLGYAASPNATEQAAKTVSASGLAAASAVTTGISAASALSTGSISGALSAAGPYGAAVGAGLEVAMNPKMIGDVTNVITQLGEDLPENIGMILTDLLPDLVMAIIKAVPAIIVGVFTDLIPMLLDALNPFNDGKGGKKGYDAMSAKYRAHTTREEYREDIGAAESKSRSRSAGRSALSSAGDAARLAGSASITIHHHGITGTMRDSDVDAIVRGISRRNGARGAGVV